MTNIARPTQPLAKISLDPGAQSILTLEQYKLLRGIDSNKRDAQLEMALPGAEDAVVRYAQRAFTQVPTVDTRSFVYEGQSILEIDDCQAVTEVKFDGVPISSDNYITGPQGIGEVFYYVELLNYPWSSYDPYIDPFIRNVHNDQGRRRRRRIVEITATYGWPSIPPSVRQAVAFLTDDFAVETTAAGAGGLQAESIADYSKVFDKETKDEPAVLPPRVQELLDPFRRVLL